MVDTARGIERTIAAGQTVSVQDKILGRLEAVGGGNGWRYN